MTIYNSGDFERLRRYIEEEPSRPKHLLTVRGVGYRFNGSPAG